MMQNKFLMDFMRTQSQLVHKAEEQQPAKKDKKGRKKSKHGTADGKAAFGDVTLELLISEKPPKKDVLEYFRGRIETLVAEEMANS